MTDEVKIGDYYLRILLQENDATATPIHNASVSNIFIFIIIFFLLRYSNQMTNLYGINLDELMMKLVIAVLWFRIKIFRNYCLNFKLVLVFRGHFFNSVYHRFLLSAKSEMRCLCLKAMAITYGRHHITIGPFMDSKYIVNMLSRCSNPAERDHLVRKLQIIRILWWTFTLLIII